MTYVKGRYSLQYGEGRWIDLNPSSPQRKSVKVTMSVLSSWLSNPFGDEYKGKITVTTQKKGESTFRDAQTLYVDIDQAWYDATNETTTATTKWLKLGRNGSGEYEIIVKGYDMEGNLVDTDEMTVSALD